MTINIPTIAILKKKLSLPKPWDVVVIFLLNILIAIPVFLVVHHNLIDLNWILQLDRIILFVVIIVLIQLLLRLVKTFIIFIVFLYFESAPCSIALSEAANCMALNRSMAEKYT